MLDILKKKRSELYPNKMKGRDITKIIFIVLSVLIIIGTAIPTVIVGASDQTNENIRSKRNIFGDVANIVGKVAAFVADVAVEGAKTVADVAVVGARAVSDGAANCLGSSARIVKTAKTFVTSYNAGAVGAGAGATVGGTIGSGVPVVGTAIGAGVGAVIGAAAATISATMSICSNQQ